MSTLRGNIELHVRTEYNSAADLSTQLDTFDRVYPLVTALAQGTGNNQATQIWHDQRSVVSGTPDDIDLRTISFMSVTQDFATIKGLLVYNRSTTAAEVLRVGANVVAPVALFGDASDYIIVKASGLLFLYAEQTGYSVAAGSTDILRIASASGTITYDIWIIGT